MLFSSTFVWVLGALQLALIVLFLFGTTYDTEHEFSTSEYSNFIDIMVMLFLGFGYLMTFLKKYGLGAVGLTMMLTVVAMQLNLFVEPFIKFIYNNGHIDFPIRLDLPSLIDAEFSAATLLISYGAIIGRASPLQLLVMAVFQSFFYAINKVIFVMGLIQAEDVGGTLTIHLFGAYFGLAVSKTFFWPRFPDNNGSSMISDVLSLIGTTLLWVYWPSFVSATETGVPLYTLYTNYCVLHTTLALLGSTAATFFLSHLMMGKFHPLHIVNSTLAGGVAIGASARLQVSPGGAFLLGILAGLLSVLGFVHVTPRMEETLGVFDTCGVHNLHGLPAVLGGIASAVFVTIDSQAGFLMHSEMGDQAGWQLLAMVATWAFAVVTGLLTGRVLVLLQSFSSDKAVIEYDDAAWWEGDYFESAALCQEEDKSGRSRHSVGIAPDGITLEGQV